MMTMRTLFIQIRGALTHHSRAMRLAGGPELWSLVPQLCQYHTTNSVLFYRPDAQVAAC